MEKVYAQTLKLPDGTAINGPVPWATNVGAIINRFIPYVFAAASFGLLLMIISGGYSILTSAGNPKGMEMGKQRITQGMIGFVIVFTAYWLVQIAGRIFGIVEINQVF
jgi:hypothetical protein